MQSKPEFFVGIDSDGCAFDTMELKHKECFIPRTIQHYGLQAVSRLAREAAEFVNLYSASRGINRFPALLETLDWLRRRPEARHRGFAVPEAPGLALWVSQETKLSNPALKAARDASGDPDLARAYGWSEAVNASIAEMVHRVPPFPGVREALERLHRRAELVVVSATPQEALQREWAEHGLELLVTAIRGQESGTKKQILAQAGAYPPGHMLMIGDAPGDAQAAQAAGALFFPIVPGREAESWARFVNEGMQRFLEGRFDRDYQASLHAEFDAALPRRPPWPTE